MKIQLRHCCWLFVVLGLFNLSRNALCGTATVVDHTCTDIRQVPTNWIALAKQNLHIAYGHTSHGTQLTDGMSSLVSFMNGRGLPINLFAWQGGGGEGLLDLRDYAFTGALDLGSPDWTAWETATRAYLAGHSECNVVIWSWCGHVSWATEANINTYLSLMDGLERDYPAVKFVHMTAHLDGTGVAGNLNVRNNQIRNHCLTNGEVLYDFADIESYDPDGLTNYMALFANDNCDYDSDGDGSLDRNWAMDWQTNHTQDVDWFDTHTAHSQPLNGNRKAYAAWWLWVRLAGWSGISDQPLAPHFTEYSQSSNGEFEVQFSGSTNAVYRLWASTNQVTWRELGVATETAPGVFRFLDTSATNWPRQFYRAGAP